MRRDVGRVPDADGMESEAVRRDNESPRVPEVADPHRAGRQAHELPVIADEESAEMCVVAGAEVRRIGTAVAGHGGFLSAEAQKPLHGPVAEWTPPNIDGDRRRPLARGVEAGRADQVAAKVAS